MEKFWHATKFYTLKVCVIISVPLRCKPLTMQMGEWPKRNFCILASFLLLIVLFVLLVWDIVAYIAEQYERSRDAILRPRSLQEWTVMIMFHHLLGFYLGFLGYMYLMCTTRHATHQRAKKATVTLIALHGVFAIARLIVEAWALNRRPEVQQTFE